MCSRPTTATRSVTRCVLLVVLVPVLWLLARTRRWVVDAAAVLIGLGLLVTFVYAGHAHTGRWVGLAMVTDVVHVGGAARVARGLCALAVTFATRTLRRRRRSRALAFRRGCVAGHRARCVVGRRTGPAPSRHRVGARSHRLRPASPRQGRDRHRHRDRCEYQPAGRDRRILAQSETPPANRNACRKARTADRSAVSTLRKAVAVEIVFAVVVLAVTAALVNTQPGRDVRDGKAWPGAPFSEELRAPPLTLAVSVVPGHTGPTR